MQLQENTTVKKYKLWISFCCFGATVLILCMLIYLYTVTAYWYIWIKKRAIRDLLTTLVLFPLWQVEMSMWEKACVYSPPLTIPSISSCFWWTSFEATKTKFHFHCILRSKDLGKHLQIKTKSTVWLDTAAKGSSKMVGVIYVYKNWLKTL